MNLSLLKTVLGIPTKTGQEKLLVTFLEDYCREAGYSVERDKHNNLFVTKGQSLTGIYPLVCAHTDSVHAIEFPAIRIETDKQGYLYGVNMLNGSRTGCGGDDKAGVFICLELLDALDCVKAAFFVGEECYCIGSQAAAPDFFQDVGYCLEFDSPQGNIVSYSCDGTQLFEEDGAFAQVAVPIMDQYGMTDWQRHPFTDVAILKRRFGFTCVNLPAGYYRMHTKQEYVKPVEVGKAIDAGLKIIRTLGCESYPFEANGYIAETRRETTGLELAGGYTID